MLQEFKKFILRGNVLDLAVAVIIGAAFGAVILSFVNDILMPPIGMLMGGADFSNLFINLSGGSYASLVAAEEAGAAVIRYGVFINKIINFLIIAFSIFMVVKAANSMQKKQPAAPPAPAAPSTEEKLLGEIRDLLKKSAAK